MNVISYSLWGSRPMFVNGIIDNIILAKKHFPGWTVVVYMPDYEIAANGQLVDTVIAQKNARIIPSGQADGYIGSFWRFQAVFDDNSVERVIVRDADDRLGLRDRWCVDQWVQSGKEFHVIRDHPNHRHNVMGGMWGLDTRNGENVSWFKSQYEKAVSEIDRGPWKISGPQKYFGANQRFMSDVIWPKYEKSVLVHDEFYKPYGNEQPIAIKRKGPKDFIGQKYDGKGRPVYSI